MKLMTITAVLLLQMPQVMIDGSKEPEKIHEAIAWQMTFDHIVQVADETHDGVEMLSKVIHVPMRDVIVIREAGRAAATRAEVVRRPIEDTKLSMAAAGKLHDKADAEFLLARDSLKLVLSPRSFRALVRYVEYAKTGMFTIPQPEGGKR